MKLRLRRTDELKSAGQKQTSSQKLFANIFKVLSIWAFTLLTLVAFSSSVVYGAAAADVIVTIAGETIIPASYLTMPGLYSVNCTINIFKDIVGMTQEIIDVPFLVMPD